MVEISEIRDEDSLKRWLRETGQDQPACTLLAHRAAMRVLPVYWAWHSTAARKGDLTLHVVSRSCLISAVAAVCPTPYIKRAAAAAFSAARSSAISDSSPAAFSAARSSAISAAESAAFSAARSSAFSAISASSAISAASAISASSSAWAEVRADCAGLADREAGETLPSPPLWQTGTPLFDDEWATARAALLRPEVGGAFWVDWYERALRGTETRWDLLQRIALSDLPPHPDGTERAPEEFEPFWEGSDAEVNARINVIWEDWKAGARAPTDDLTDPALLDRVEARTYNAETVSFNDDTGKWRVDPVTDLAPVHLQEAVEELEDLVNRLRNDQGVLHNPYPLDREVAMLADARRLIRAPRRLHSLCRTALRRVQSKIANGDCPDPATDADMADLVGTLLDVTTTLINRDPEVREAVALTDSAPDIAPDSREAETLAAAAQELVPVSEGALMEDFGLLAQIVISLDVSAEERREAVFVLSSRMVRIWRDMVRWEKGVRDGVVETNAALKPYVELTKTATWLAGLGLSPVWLPKASQVILRLFGG